jgi:D-3-phosphoglycerate dehydrogenase
MCRFIYDSNRNMPSSGYTDFDSLKKKYAAGVELRGKTIGIIGIGRIGQAVAQIALGSGMKVIAHDPYISQVDIKVNIYGVSTLPVVSINTVSMDELLSSSDFISVHVPGGNLIGETEIASMKKGVCLINASRGGVIDETALIKGLISKQIAHAALDVFMNEPQPSEEILKHPQISLTPHIGAATNEAQERIGVELASLIINHFKQMVN